MPRKQISLFDFVPEPESNFISIASFTEQVEILYANQVGMAYLRCVMSKMCQMTSRQKTQFMNNEIQRLEDERISNKILDLW
jgi:hypothetical protein